MKKKEKAEEKREKERKREKKRKEKGSYFLFCDKCVTVLVTSVLHEKSTRGFPFRLWAA